MYKFTIYYDDGEIRRLVLQGPDLFSALSTLRRQVPNAHVWNCKAVLITREECSDADVSPV